MPEVIEITASEVAAESQRLRVASDERVTLLINAEHELFPGRRESRKLVAVAGLTDADLDRLIEQGRGGVASRPG